MTQTINFDDTEIAFKSKSTAELVRAQLLFRTFANPTLLAAGPKLMNLAFSLHLPVSPLVKWTVFNQFCGGVTLSDCMGRVDELAKFKIRSILDYSVEGLGREKDFDDARDEIHRVILRAASDRRLPYAVFKVSGIARVGLLERISSSAKLTQAESEEFQRVEGRFDSLCKAAHGAGVGILVDAEESWIQPVIDLMANKAMGRYNTERALVFNTIQMYRVGRLSFLKGTLRDAKSHGYKAGIKLVRGAYMEKERHRALAGNLPSPIHINKEATDSDFDEAVKVCFAALDHCAVFAGTHNEKSNALLVGLIVKSGLARDDARIEFSQLLGMSDNLTYNLAHHGFNVSKYVPYGPVKSVMPYLVRRAEENTSIKGQSGRELQLIQRELKRRS